jgi:cytochrome c oxidase assembly protein subunit 15
MAFGAARSAAPAVPAALASPALENSALHRFATFVAGCTVLLVLAGSLVTSTGSGLSVPDWPTTYGWNMFSFPPSKWVGGILYEHGHRLIASTVGFLTIILAAWLAFADPRRWMKWLGAGALGAVIAQGVLGGLTVLFFLPASISTAHAGLAEIFFCLTVAIALFTSPGWIEGYFNPNDHQSESLDDPALRRVATITTALVYTQILIGATMRHTGAGLAIPDFPLMFGHVWPTHWDPKIAIHFAHRVGALVVTLAVAATTFTLWFRGSRPHAAFARPAALLIALVLVQITLGALTVLSGLYVWINSLHVVCGALVLTTSLVLTLRTWRTKFGTQAVRLKPDATPSAAGPTHGVRLQPDETTGVRA